MDAKLLEISQQQKDTWNKFSPGWKKWDDITMQFLMPMGDEIIRQLNLKETDIVLDVAAGTGEPGLTIAGILKTGKLICTDQAEGMLAVAAEKAKAKGLDNFETKVCDATELPFADNSFDCVSCRFGFMFFPDMLLAAKEMARVLKPGGRVAFAVWGAPEKNFWVTAMGSTINKNMQLQPPPPGAPGMFRCAAPGLMTGIFKEAGLSIISEKEIKSKLLCGTTDVYWDMMMDVAAPFASALSKADDAMKAKIKQEVYALINKELPGEVNFNSSSIVICAGK